METTPADSQTPPSLHATRCAICGCADNAEELYPARQLEAAFTPAVFSARRLPDGTHHRMVRCRTCALIRADPVLDSEFSAELYRASTFDYGEELDGIRRTYGAAIDRLAELVPARRGLVDIGCGNGFVLELARERGWTDVRGVEPSTDAIAHADPAIAGLIVADVMRDGLLPPASFDAVTLFQVLDHMPDPQTLLRDCRTILRPGGVIMAFNHNVTALSARLMGERSPIVDVEHTYLYSPDTMRRLFSAAGFQVVSVGPVRNTYSLSYLMHLLPLPPAAKARLLPGLRRTRVGRTHVTVPLGNLCLIARREE